METIHLLGAEEVSRGGSMIQSAVHDFRQSILNLQSTFESHERFMTNWLIEFTNTLENNKIK